MVSRAQLEQFTESIHREPRLNRGERKPEMAGLTGFHLEPDGSMLLEFDLAQARLQSEAQLKDQEAAPTALVTLCNAASLALPTAPHAR